MKRKILFVCTGNIDRSPTAQKLYKNREDLEVKSAGISESAPNKLTKDLVNWADQIFAMENKHRDRIIGLYPKTKRKIIVLDIPDNYNIENPRERVKLEDIIVEKARIYLGEP